MQSIILLFSLLSLALASPILNAEPQGFDEMGALSKRQNDFSDTRNELSECKPVTVIYARGTSEPGNVGAGPGPPFFNALDVAIGAENVGVQGVDYPATVEGYVVPGGDNAPAATAAQLLEQAASQCPETQIVLSGYSQGAIVVHLGEALVSAEVAARIAAVVVFGDPYKDRPFPNILESNVDTYCFAQDLICDDTDIVTPWHLEYAQDAVPAADFVAQHVRV